MAPASRSLNSRAVVAAVIGNALEWYDLTVFGFLTVVIAQLFFPAGNDYSSMLLTTATFGVAFVMRKTTGSPLAPTYYVMGGLALSIVAVACIPGKRHADLDAQRKPA